MSDFNIDEHQILAAAAQARSELEQTETAFDQVRVELLEALAATALADRDTREQLYMGVNILERVRQALRIVATSGAVVEHNQLIRSVLQGKEVV